MKKRYIGYFIICIIITTFIVIPMMTGKFNDSSITQQIDVEEYSNSEESKVLEEVLNEYEKNHAVTEAFTLTMKVVDTYYNHITQGAYIEAYKMTTNQDTISIEVFTTHYVALGETVTYTIDDYLYFPRTKEAKVNILFFEFEQDDICNNSLKGGTSNKEILYIDDEQGIRLEWINDETAN